MIHKGKVKSKWNLERLKEGKDANFAGKLDIRIENADDVPPDQVETRWSQWSIAVIETAKETVGFPNRKAYSQTMDNNGNDKQDGREEKMEEYEYTRR